MKLFACSHASAWLPLLILLILVGSLPADTVTATVNGSRQTFNDVTVNGMNRAQGAPAVGVSFPDGDAWPVNLSQIQEIQFGSFGDGRQFDLTVGEGQSGQLYSGATILRFFRPQGYPGGGFVAREPGGGAEFLIPSENVLQFLPEGTDQQSQDSSDSGQEDFGSDNGDPWTENSQSADSGNGDEWGEDYGDTDLSEEDMEAFEDLFSNSPMFGTGGSTAGMVVSIIASIANLICFFIVLINMFMAGDVGEALFGLICCNIYVYIWGWTKWEAGAKGTVMLIWTASIVGYLASAIVGGL